MVPRHPGQHHDVLQTLHDASDHHSRSLTFFFLGQRQQQLPLLLPPWPTLKDEALSEYFSHFYVLTTMKTGPNDARCIVWALYKLFLILRISLCTLDFFLYIFFLSKGQGRPWPDPTRPDWPGVKLTRGTGQQNWPWPGPARPPDSVLTGISMTCHMLAKITLFQNPFNRFLVPLIFSNISWAVTPD